MQGKLKLLIKLAQLTLLLVSLTCTIAAQQADAAQFNPDVYRVGERLTYTVQFSQFVGAAHVELFVASRGVFASREAVELRGHVETTGVVNVALFAINNDYVTYVDPATGLPFRSQQVVREQGKSNEASREYNQPFGADAIQPKLRTGESVGHYDLLSALYRVRAMPLQSGGSFYLTIAGDGDQYQAEVKVLGRRLIKTNVGSFNTIAVRINARNDYSTRIYFSDDEWHVPVLVTAKHPEGEVRIELAASELSARPPVASSTPRPTPQPRRTPTPAPVRPAERESGSPPSGSPGTDGVSATISDFPFKVGEQLNYQVYLANTPEPVGSVTLTVKSKGKYFNRDGLMLTAAAQTNGAGARVFPVSDAMTSYVDPVTLLPFRIEMKLSEGKWRKELGYNLDQNRGAAVSDKRERIEIPVGTHDLISLLYATRTFELSPQKRNALSILAISRPRTLFIQSLKRETIQIGDQKIPAIQLSLTTDDPQSDKGQIRLWIGDDNRRLPLRMTAVTPLGPVRADLVVAPVPSPEL